MIRPKSHADVMTDWEELLQALQINPDLQQLLETERQSLTQSLAEMQGLKARQNELQGLRQEVTQKLTAAMAKGKETALIVRSVVRGKVGPKNERLVQFKIAPLRKRPRKPKQEVKKPAEGAPGKNPGASVPPSGGSAA